MMYKTRVISTLPESTTLRLLGDTHAIARRMTRRIAEGNALPPRFGSIRNLRSVTRACREALETLLTLLREGRGLRPGDLDRLGAMGAREAENGLPLEVLLGAYRIAARVLWEEVISSAVQRNELAPDTVVTATGYVLEYFDLISGAVGRAYLETRERLVLQRGRERERILQRLLAGEVTSELQHLAAAADLELHPPYQVIACSHEARDSDALAQAMQKLGSLQVPISAELTLILLPLAMTTATLHERLTDVGIVARFGVGPVAWTLSNISGSARDAQEVLGVGSVLDADRMTYEYGEYAPFALLNRDASAARAFVQRELGALDEMSAKRRDDALETMEAVVRTSTLADAADHLRIHRHTLMYRLDRLADAGIDLQQPDRRNRLWLALRLRPLLT